jgi:uncharacterized protein YcaQ
MTRDDTLSLAEARRIALAAQGFADRRPASRSDRRHVARVLDRIALLQIDSVNVLVRSHYLPLFSRLGAYPMEVVDRLAYGRKPRALFEYWGHMASLLPVALHPLLRWRMEWASRGDRIYKGLARYGDEKRAYIERVLAEVRDRGPIAVSDLSEGAKNQGSWWGWGDGKMALEWLFYAGKVTTATRRGFERIYDLPERVLPAEILSLPTPSDADAQRQLMEIGARAHGIGTAFDLRDYFRLPPEESKARLSELVEAGRLKQVRVEGWKEPAYLHAEAAIPRRLSAQALLSPFDPVVWMRDRGERLFDFHYRIGLYTPKDKRTHGYYVLPFLFGNRLVARVDLKADRQTSRLQVLGAHPEGHAKVGEIAEPLKEELARMAGWLGLERVQVTAKGALGQHLR